MKTLRQELKNAIRIFSLLLVLLAPLTSWAAAGKVVIAAGEVFAIDAQEQRRPLQRRSDIFEGDTLVTGADGRLQLRFEDNAILALRADSQLRISEYHGATDSQNERVLMDLLGGGFRTISGSFGKSERDAYQVRTPNASIGIRGTHYEAVFQSDTLTVGVYEGGIVLTNDQGSLNLGLDSEFVFAQVQAGNLPQGLLNPPANLNVPNTPETGSDEEGDEDEGSDEDGDGDLNNDSPAGSTDDPGTGVINDTDNNSDFGANEFNFSELEDAFIELQQKSVVLTEAEREALDGAGTVVGILVMAPSETDANGNPISELGPIIAYSSAHSIGVETDQEFFVAYENQGTSENLSNPPNFILRPNATYNSDGGDTLFPWQQWNYVGQENDGPAGTTDAGENTGFNAGTIEQPFYFIETEPTQANLAGTIDFSLSNLETAAGGSMFSQSPVGGDMTVYFDDGYAEGGISYTSSDSSIWNLDFSGSVQGTTLNATLTSNSSVISGQGEGSPIGLEGNVNGIFTGEVDGGPSGMTGGFTAQSNNGELEDYGVFTMDKVTEENGPPPPN
ncbi:FecR family protein [Saccharospirillum sp. HFRX-1]|uniref:FecR family protein n=1 Tax=unclassified Saccharospirillum TaxID=2633430 RepID=UPI003724C472